MQGIFFSASRVSDRAFLFFLLAAGAAGAAALNTRYYVGYFNDDASFILLAQTLWARLLALSASGLGGVFGHFLPGYPLFLMPFVAAFEPHWAWLRWVSAGVSLLGVYGLWRLLDGWLTAEERRWATLTYALHPLFLLSSGMVMADSFLACLFIFGLLGLRGVLENGRPASYALLIAACAWAAAAKPIGLLLPLTLTIVFAAARAWRPLRLTALLFWLPVLAVMIYSALQKQTPTDYVTYMLQGLASLSGQPLWERAYVMFHSFVLVCGLGMFWPRGPVWDLSGAALIAVVLYFCVKGLAVLLSRQGPGRFAALAAGGLILGQGLVMSLWTVYSERYALPMLPLAIVLLTAGVCASWKARPFAPRVLLAVLAAGFALHAAQLALITRSPQAPAESRLCVETLDWIKLKTPPESRFVGNIPLVHLYTGRYGDGLFAARDLDLFLTALSRSRITHVLVTDQTILSAKGTYRNDHALQKKMENGWVISHPRYFTKIYANPRERTAIFSVNLPSGLEKAVEFYSEALQHIQGTDLAVAEQNLRLALKEERDFPSALVALATVRLVRGKDAREAERLLRRALALEPNFPRASGTLAALMERQGRAGEAEKVRSSARAALSLCPFEAGS